MSQGKTSVPPATDPQRTRFSGAAITGMLLVTIVWVIITGPLISMLGRGGSGDPTLDFIVLSGLIVLLGGVAGFVVALINGNKRRAARLYIIPSLIWQGTVLAAVIWLLIALANYDPYGG